MSTETTARTARAAQLFHAFSDVTRLEIIGMLDSGERCVCELQDTLDAAQSRLSFHLKVLKDAGLVRDRREGRWSYYELNRKAFDDAEAMLRRLRPRLRPRLSPPTRRHGSNASACC